MITQKRLREQVSYDPASGKFHWLKNLRGGVRAGDEAGVKSRAGRATFYRRIRIDGALYHAHRLAWLYMTGAMPAGVDHLDGDGLNNAWANLRDASQQQNTWNARVRYDNTSGFKGVTRRGSKWIAQIADGGKTRYLGMHSSASAAADAYDAAAAAARGEFACTNHDMGLR